MKKAIIIDGGAGRVIASIPALIKHIKNNVDDEIYIFVNGWDSLLWGIPELHDIVYSINTKGIFDNIIKNCDVVLSPEPYQLPRYFRQEISLVQAFDEAINNTTCHDDLSNPTLVLNKAEEKSAVNYIHKIKKEQHKKHTIVIQPYGRSAYVLDGGGIIDEMSRSFNQDVYLKLVKALATKYNLIFFGEEQFQLEEDVFTHKINGDIRMWAALVKAADYFIGCDSLGQHMARAFDKPGTIVLGSTYAINTTYPDFFNIYQKPNVEIKYSPIRICEFDCHMADRINDRCMDLSDEEITNLYTSIVKDIEAKVN